jgi:hypothetical protein
LSASEAPCRLFLNARSLTRKWGESCKTTSKSGVFGIPCCYEKSYEIRFRKTSKCTPCRGGGVLAVFQFAFKMQLCNLISLVVEVLRNKFTRCEETRK